MLVYLDKFVVDESKEIQSGQIKTLLPIHSDAGTCVSRDNRSRVHLPVFRVVGRDQRLRLPLFYQLLLFLKHRGQRSGRVKPEETKYLFCQLVMFALRSVLLREEQQVDNPHHQHYLQHDVVGWSLQRERQMEMERDGGGDLNLLNKHRGYSLHAHLKCVGR